MGFLVKTKFDFSFDSIDQILIVGAKLFGFCLVLADDPFGFISKKLIRSVKTKNTVTETNNEAP